MAKKDQEIKAEKEETPDAKKPAEASKEKIEESEKNKVIKSSEDSDTKTSEKGEKDKGSEKSKKDDTKTSEKNKKDNAKTSEDGSKDKKDTGKGSDNVNASDATEKDSSAKKETPTTPSDGGRRPPERGARRSDRGRFKEVEFDPASWEPRTQLGMMVKSGEITDMHQVVHSSRPLKEVEIVDMLLPELDEEILSIDNVQRATDSGRRMRFRVVVTVGNRDGFMGVGVAKGKEVGPTIRRSIVRAKLNIMEIKRGCGSWECGCGNLHTVPFRIQGKRASVRVTVLPSPRGIGLVSGEMAKKVLALAGISDAWVHTEGHTRTTINFAFALFDALTNTNRIKQ